MMRCIDCLNSVVPITVWFCAKLRIKFLFYTLDVYHLRFRLFPEPLLRSLKSGNSPSAQTARIFTRLSQWFFTGNNQRLNNRHLRLDELFAVGRYLALLPFRSGAMFTFLVFGYYFSRQKMSSESL